MSNDDLHLKLRFRRVLHLLGYYSPIEVQLSAYDSTPESSLARSDVTDIDVLGIRLDPLLSVTRVVADCKSSTRRKSLSDPNRLFWLRGVTLFFQASEGYFLRPRVSTEARAIAPKLGLRVLDVDELATLEKNLAVATSKLPLTDEAVSKRRDSLWGIDVPSGESPTAEQLRLKKVYTYLRYSFWYVEMHRNLLSVLEQFRSVADLLRETDERHVLLTYTGLQHFGVCMLTLASSLMSRGIGDLVKNARLYLYGGPMALRERQDLVELLRDTTGRKMALDPDYLTLIFEQTNRITKNPHGASLVLPLLEAVYYWEELLGEKNVAEVAPSAATTQSLVLARDLANTFVRCTGIRGELLRAANNL